MRQKLRVVTSIIMMIMLLAGCAANESAQNDEKTNEANAGKDKAEKKDKITIGLSEPDLGWPYIAAFVEEFNSLIEEDDKIEAIVLSADGDIEKQVSDISDLTVQEVDIILVCSLDGEAVIPALAQASSSEIPLLAVSNEPGKDGQQYLEGYSGPDDYVQGEIAAEIMKEAIGTEGKIVMIEGTAGQSTTQLRGEGLKDKLAEIAPGIEVIDAQPCDWDASKEKSATSAFLTKYGSEIKGIFAQGGGDAVAEAVQTSPYDIPVVCTGCNQITLDGIREGRIYGTMQQSPYLDAKQAIDLAKKIVNGEKLEEFRNIISMPIVTAENCKDVEADF